MKWNGHNLIKGTIILILTGIITRIIGFLYKIYLADLLGPETLGIYQLVFPVYSICFTIYAAGIQTAISQVVAAGKAKKKDSSSLYKLLFTGMAMGLCLAVCLSILLTLNAEKIACYFMKTPALAPFLKELAVLFPFCCITSCINGYYFGVSDAKVPAMTQVVEQIVRVAFVGSGCTILASTKMVNCSVAVWGLVAGEISSNIYNVYHLRKSYKKKVNKTGTYPMEYLRPLLWLSLTLTATKLMISLLHSAESILIPGALQRYGCTTSEALSIYGILTGMSLSFIFFPSTITNSLSVMLLPSIADAWARKDTFKIKKAVAMSLKYSLLIGVLCTGIFLLFGMNFGLVFFHNEDAGNYLFVLAWLCPFLYVTTTLTSILNGMEKTQVTFIYTLLSLGVKIAVLLWFVPAYGIRAYLIGLLVSELLLALLESIHLLPYLTLDAIKWVVVPACFLLLAGSITKSSYEKIAGCFSGIASILFLLLVCGTLCIAYAAFLYVAGIISKNDISTSSRTESTDIHNN